MASSKNSIREKTAFYFVRPPFFRSDARLLAISG